MLFSNLFGGFFVVLVIIIHCSAQERKDYRQLTKREMNQLHKALKRLKTQSKTYDDLVKLHGKGLPPAAHFGEGFLRWHRDYIIKLDKAARNLGKKFRHVTIPFWDSCMDESLPDPRDCVVWWTKNFWGPGDGFVNSGKVAKNWDVTPNCKPSKLVRSYKSNNLFLLNRVNINHTLGLSSFSAMQYRLKLYHIRNHVYVGGHMSKVFCAPNDPVYFFLQAMYNCLWYEWASLPGCHQRPSKIWCDKDADCLSPQRLLFCHDLKCHCKIREGGNCTGFRDNACYCQKRTPECNSDICRCK